MTRRITLADLPEDARRVSHGLNYIVVHCDMCGKDCWASRMPDRTDRPCPVHGWLEREFVLCDTCAAEMPSLVAMGHGSGNK